jgi:hypothetical protein
VRPDGLRRRARPLLGRLALRAQRGRPAPARQRAAEPDDLERSRTATPSACWD